MALSLQEFGKAVVGAKLLSADELKAQWDAIPADARPKQPPDFARRLVECAKLTAYQAAELVAGRGDRLLLGEYLLVDQLGAGGMGQVFKALHRRMDRLVALKVMAPGAMKDPEAIKRFQREVKAVAKLSHPNIVTAHDAGEHHGLHFLVMEYVAGSDLGSLVREQGVMEVDHAIHCTLQAAQGLAYAHQQGVVHRDIKPANLLLDKKGMVKVLDLGLARFADAPSNEGLTASEQVMGTADYMAPEQATDTRHADARSDIYSLGCTLWYLLTGQRMYDGETVLNRMMAHQQAEIPSLAQRRDEVSMPLDQLYRRMVAKRPDERFQSMSEVATALENLRASSSSMSRLVTEDSGFRHFAQYVDERKRQQRTQGGRTTSKTQAQPAPSTAPEAPTVDFRQGSAGTDPKSEDSLPKPAIVTRAKRQRTVWLASGALGLLVVALATALAVSRNWKTDPLQPIAPVTNPTASTNQAKVAPPVAKAPFDTTQARVLQQFWAAYLRAKVEEKNSIGMKLVLIPPGEFLMGSTDEQVAVALKVADEIKADEGTKNRIRDGERPQHRVVITRPFRLGQTEVTVGQFRKFVEAEKYVTETEKLGGGHVGNDKDGKPMYDPARNWRAPGHAVTDDSPVVLVTWNDAVAFCNWLSEQEQRGVCYRRDATAGWVLVSGNGYRLPTEAEWEYACRAGTTTQYSFGDDVSSLELYAWYKHKNAGDRTHAVGTLSTNAFGLYDMHGNVYEWCQDWYDANYYQALFNNEDPKGPPAGSSRVIRGGFWNSIASVCRSAARHGYSPTDRSSYFGFRVVRVE